MKATKTTVKYEVRSCRKKNYVCIFYKLKGICKQQGTLAYAEYSWYDEFSMFNLIFFGKRIFNWRAGMSTFIICKCMYKLSIIEFF